jgi:hypothetical protein
VHRRYRREVCRDLHHFIFLFHDSNGRQNHFGSKPTDCRFATCCITWSNGSYLEFMRQAVLLGGWAKCA